MVSNTSCIDLIIVSHTLNNKSAKETFKLAKQKNASRHNDKMIELCSPKSINNNRQHFSRIGPFQKCPLSM